MKCILYFYLLTQLTASYFIHLHLANEKFYTHMVLLIVATLTYTLTSIKDPGFYHPTRIQQQTQSQQEVGYSQTKKCKDCNMQQLLRMKHCQDCRFCVATFDHHCVWVDNCVGEKNRPIFIVCLLSNLIEMGYAMFQLIVTMWQRGEKLTSQIVFLSFLGILLSGVMVLLAMHCYLMAVNLTTREILRWDKIEYLGVRNRKLGSPFSRGLLTNLKDYWIQGFTYKFKVWRVEKQNLNTLQEETQNESRQEASNKNIVK